MAQTISIDPMIWATIRKLAFDQQTSASKLVEAAISEYLERREKDRDGLATEPDTHEVYVEFRKDGVIKPIASGPGKLKLDGPTGQLAAPPWADPPPVAIAPSANDKGDSFGAAALIVPVTGGGSVVADAVIPALEKRLTDGPKIINDPQVAAAVATQQAQLAGRVFHPVPKPEPAKKPTRRR